VKTFIHHLVSISLPCFAAAACVAPSTADDGVVSDPGSGKSDDLRDGDPPWIGAPSPSRARGVLVSKMI
jgi:hypothetical protein